MPSKTKGPHHKGTYHTHALALVAAAYANPATVCGRCGKTLAQHPHTKTGKPPRWSAGHITDGQVGGPLRPEVLSCNARAGAAMGNRKRGTRRTTLTW